MSFLLRFGKPRTFVQAGAFTGGDDLSQAWRRSGAAASAIRVILNAVSNYNGPATFHIAVVTLARRCRTSTPRRIRLGGTRGIRINPKTFAWWNRVGRAHGFQEHISWQQSMNREENIVFRNRRGYRPLIDAVVAAWEQIWMWRRLGWVKLPRVFAGTRTKRRQKLSGERS